MKQAVLVILFSASLLFGAGAEPVHVEFYYSPDCEHCDSIMNEIIIPIQKQYPEKVVMELINIDDEANNNANYARLIKREEASGQSAPNIPVIFIGDQMLSGSIASRTRFPELLGRELARLSPQEKTDTQPGDTIKESEGEYKLSPNISQDDNSVVQTVEKVVEPVNLVYFFKKGCNHCARVTYDLRLIQSEYPAVVIHKFDVETDEGGQLSEHLSQKAGIPDEQHLASPAIFIADTFILPEELTYKGIVNLIEKYRDNAPDISRATPEELKAAEERIKSRFKAFSPWMILSAGLIDGLNPCAFGVIIFFVMFLSTLKRSKWEIFLTGTAFTLSVFVTYFLVGVGVLKFLTALPFFNTISKWVYAITALLALIFAVLSLVDFFRTYKGDASDMLLKMPDSIKKRIHKTILKENSPRAKRNMVLAATTTGFLVSIMELACTGQVYLPTLIHMTRGSDTRGTAWLFLFLYNVMFIIPLVIIFIIAMAGVSSQQLTNFLKKNTRWIKLLLAFIFFALAYYLAQDVAFISPVVNGINGFFTGMFS